ncbi:MULTISPECIES: heavy metal translocating P-type ATPase [Sphingobium]|jgi:Cd2+/Zn2+-exporting ATPase|uniref:P-type Zn(2+) transporter n=3 Tax=Sphingobium TaxID=165695 RepID=A0A3G2UL04_SPHYA|nr:MULTISPECIES: heavy metal translocating P-type ATPase [Sphingobium]AYO75840.1 heavy metal translocating P-type ATPase [Sphingobium yanoikuyae]KAA9011426.1 heavy metal translocating P-type ATPase [Sphingobium limneticum]KAA9023706.1 heavy metal translocating P-type ATPase [Sphingobium limneticum]MDG2515142.1 heavy metal translocating P-type ATPase [Sphingobium yanoikuyae]QDC40271.1 heavy metal translocating P-type ATPase [Sphingobium fuliginis ATCC 27551]
MRADATAMGQPSSLRFKVDGLDCQNEVRALREAVSPVVGGDDKLSFNTQAGVMEVLSGDASMLDAIQRAVATTGMRAHLLPEDAAQETAPTHLFRVDGLNCQNEVATLKREIGPLVGGDAWLMFDAAKGFMTVAPQRQATVDDIIGRVARTGMRASLVVEDAAEAMLFRVHGLDCKNEVATLTRELGPLVGEDKLAFDTARGTITVAPQSRATADAIEQVVIRASMRAELWTAETVSFASAETASMHNGSAGSCGAVAQEALDPPIPTRSPGQIVFRIHGMDCADEIAALKREVGPLVGDDRLAFDLLNGRMSISVAPNSMLEARIEKAVARAGLQAEPWTDGDGSEAAKTEERRKRVQSWLTTASGLLTALGFAVHAWLGGGVIAAFEAGEHALGSTPLPSIMLYTLAVLSAARYVAPKAWLSAKRLRPDMNLLMMVAVAGAIGIGAWFEAATVSFFFALALALEAWSLGRARRAVAALMELAPPTARVKLDDGSERDVPAAEVRVGAHIIVRPGDKVPLDGRVAIGESEVNQAPITGESVPVFKAEGDDVYAGTINGEGALEILTTKAANDTTLAQIIRMVGSAQSLRAPSEQWVEKFARIYTPVVMVLAVAIFLAPPLLLGSDWDVWFYRALVLLVIACPCALVISTPVTIVAALAGAAKQGVLVKGGTHLETPARLKAIAMDKTGTLTEGRPAVVEIVPLGGRSEAELLGLAAALEARSGHPIARAILAKAVELKIAVQPAQAVQAITGRGVIGRVDGREMWLGSRRYIEERGINSPEVLQRADTLSSAGRTIVAVGDGQDVWGLVAVADAVRPEAKDIVTALHRAGIEHVVMLTGDNRATAETIAKQTGIDEVRAELLPGDKVAAVEDLVRRYGSVAMVGDGVNDAPAMGRANLGIAMGAVGSDAAIETADVALMSDDLSRLPWLVRHSRATLAVIRQNVAFSIFVKLVFTVLTVVGLASLWGAIAADVGASLLVVLNGLRLLNRGQATLEGGGPSTRSGAPAHAHHEPMVAAVRRAR